jgi:hypothetical protein
MIESMMSGDDLLDLLIRQRQQFVFVHGILFRASERSAGRTDRALFAAGESGDLRAGAARVVGIVMSGHDLLDLLIRQRQQLVLVHRVSLGSVCLRQRRFAYRLFRRPGQRHRAAREPMSGLVMRSDDLFDLVVVELE